MPAIFFQREINVLTKAFDMPCEPKHGMYTIDAGNLTVTLGPLSCLESIAAAARARRLHVAVLLGGGGSAVGGLAGGPQHRQVPAVLRPLQRTVPPYLEPS